MVKAEYSYSFFGTIMANSLVFRDHGYRDDKGLQQRCKVQVLQVIADLPAKAQLLNHLQYNGQYGCSVSRVFVLHFNQTDHAVITYRRCIAALVCTSLAVPAAVCDLLALDG